MIDFEYLMNPEKYHTVPTRIEGEKDEQYKARLKAYVQGVESQQGEVDKLQTKIDELNERHSEDKRIFHNVIEMNQSKINELQARVVELTKTLSEVQMMSHKSISYEHDLFDKGWNQASKQVVINIHRLTGIGEGLLK